MRFTDFVLLPFLFAIFFSTPSFATNRADMYGAEFSFNHGSGWQKYQLGTKVMRDKVFDLLVQYNFAKQPGPVGVLTLLYPQSPGDAGTVTGVIPKGAVITGCLIDVITSVTSAGAATLAFGTGQSATDILGATAKTTFVGGTIVACVPVGTAATDIKINTDVSPTMTVGTAALTGGKLNLHIQYVLSDL